MHVSAVAFFHSLFKALSLQVRLLMMCCLVASHSG
jgi:hypothetical protein